MKLSEELKRRIRQLEEEQSRQDVELKELNELRDLAAITELENELKRIEKKGIAPQTSGQKVEDLELAREREVLELGEEAQKELRTEEPSKSVENIDLSEELLGQKPEKIQTTGGYAVCLVFNPTSPSEWSDESGGGWRGKGLGTHYPALEDAQKQLAQLKKKWPDYPLKLIKV